MLKNPPQSVRPAIKQIAKPQASPKQHLAGMTKTQLCKLIFKHESMEKQRIDMIQKQQILINKQSKALIWMAKKIGQIAEQFPAIQEKVEFKELLKMAADLVTQAEQFKAFEDKENTDGGSSQEEATGKGGGDDSPEEGTEELRDPDPARVSDQLPAEPGGSG